MPAVRLAFVCAIALLAFASPAQGAKLLPGPKQLRGFMLRADERASLHRHTFPRTPAFAWRPVAGAKRYEFELSTSEVGDDGAVIWSSESLDAPIKTPATSVPVSLPWITGNPYSLYARVRAIDSRGRAGRWSRPYGFNMRWPAKPVPMNPQYPGLIRWTPVEGATMYEVWLRGARSTFLTTTNVADQRDYYTFHRTMPWMASVDWRVRAVRRLYGDIPNGLPAVSYGPWSDVFVNLNPPTLPGLLSTFGTASGSVVSPAAAPSPTAHELTPGFLWHGDTRGGSSFDLFRVAVFTDVDCVNRVYSSSVVGSPAWAPRVGSAIKLPGTAGELASAANDWPAYGPGAEVLTPNGEKFVSADEAGGTAPPGQSSVPKIDLWDTAWPRGGYYWQVIPVTPVPSRNDPDKLEYREVEIAEDACRSSGAVRFGKQSSAPRLGDKAPYISGLSPNGRLLSASRVRRPFYGTPIVAWEPVWNAHEYEIQWSRRGNPWQTVGSLTTPATATVLPIAKGVWYYRVRGLNHSLPKKPEMTWSKPVRLRVAGPRFRIVRR
ncbi:MAG TPA: hypothetical protein VFL61_15645 [Gaiellaceae bacterium]|nr:hypothetical protein [Gaiellaceae bacterium]